MCSSDLGNGKTLKINGRQADDERGYIDLNKIRKANGRYLLVTADIYSPENATFSTLKLKSPAKDGEAWMRICDASTLKPSVIESYGEAPPTLVGSDLALIDIDELGQSKGAFIGYFKLNDDNLTWSWVTRSQDYKAENKDSYNRPFALLKQLGKDFWSQFLA